MRGTTLKYLGILYRESDKTADKTVDLYTIPTRDMRIGGEIIGHNEAPRWDLFDNRLLLGAAIPSNLRLIFLAAEELQIANNRPWTQSTPGSFQTRIIEAAGKQGFALKANNFTRVQMPWNTPNSIEDALSSLGIDNPDDSRCTLVFLVLRKKNAQMYQHFKDVADRTYGVHSI